MSFEQNGLEAKAKIQESNTPVKPCKAVQNEEGSRGSKMPETPRAPGATPSSVAVPDRTLRKIELATTFWLCKVS